MVRQHKRRPSPILSSRQVVQRPSAPVKRRPPPNKRPPRKKRLVKKQKSFKQKSKSLNLKIIQKYGVKPTITFYYYSLNPVEYVGEEQVRKSFASIKKEGREVIVGDYGSTDNIKEIVEEFGFKFLDVEKTPNIFFHETKIANKIMKEASNDFLCYLNFWCIYPEDFEDFMQDWLKKNNITKKYLKMTGYGVSPEGKLGKTKGVTHSVSTLLYKHYLLEARGWDERTSYHAGARNYAVRLLGRVFGLAIDEHFVEFVHIAHTNKHWNKVPLKQQQAGLNIVQSIIANLQKRFFQEVKNIHNSYW